MSFPASDSAVCPPRPQREPAPGGALLCRAPAKLNLALRVLGRRADGYHEIDSIVAKVTLYDELILRRRREGQISLESSPFDCGPSQENLVVRAARLLQPMAGRAGVDVALRKQIPPGAGLGGGSSDAAAALQALNRLWELGLSQQELAALAGGLGCDVPLFLDGPAVRVRGRGERVEPIGVHPFFAVLHLSGLSCKTAEVYARYDEIAPEQPSLPRAPQSAGFAGRLDRPCSAWRGDLFNDLQPTAAQVCPRLVGISARLAEATGLPVHLTGSGSAVFMLADDEGAAREAFQALPAEMRARSRIVSLNPW